MIILKQKNARDSMKILEAILVKVSIVNYLGVTLYEAIKLSESVGIMRKLSCQFVLTIEHVN